MRTFKQIAYGFFYLLILAAILYAVYLIWFKPAPSCFNGFKDPGEQGIDCGGICSRACQASGLSAIEIASDPQIFHPTASSISVVAQIQNKNAAFATQILPYKFSFYDANDNLLYEKSDESFIYASEIKYVAEFNLQFADISKVAYAKFSMGEPNWVSDSLFSKPALVPQNFNTSSSDAGVQVTGNLLNNGAISIPRVTVLAVFYTNIGQPAGISKNEVDDVMPGERRPFLIIHPPLGNLNSSGTKVYLYGD
ncbi:MAG: hypothetical protein Q7K44_02915 [Candidatus Liptonbacteria bacterium]|nr:hypothetical protein [Candidatus Liptonbacteria bacterium]